MHLFDVPVQLLRAKVVHVFLIRTRFNVNKGVRKVRPILRIQEQIVLVYVAIKKAVKPGLD